MINYKDELIIEQELGPDVLEKLSEFLELKEEGPISDYILEFCEVNSYRIEEVGEIISKSKLLKGIIKQDCYHHKIFRPKIKIEEL